METRIESCPHWAIVYVTGEIDAQTCKTLENAIRTVLEEGQRTVLIDMEHVGYISSAGLRVILSTAQKLYGCGRLAVSQVNADVMEIMEMAGFRNIIDFFPNSSAATLVFSTPEP